MRSVIETDEAPPAAGAYSQGIVTEEFVFTAGQTPVTPSGEILADKSIGIQTTRCLQNIQSVVSDAGLEITDIVKVTVYLSDIEKWDGMNKSYEEFFDEEAPARSAIAVSGISGGVDVEIEAIAVRD